MVGGAWGGGWEGGAGGVGFWLRGGGGGGGWVVGGGRGDGGKGEAYVRALKENAPLGPNHCSKIPPKRGPIMRVPLFVALSRLMAGAILSNPAMSPSNRRRKGISVAQTIPAIRLETATNQ